MKILFGADVVPTAKMEQRFIDVDVDGLFHDVAPLLKSADRVMINLECALTKSENAIPKIGPNLKADPACVNTLKAIGVTDVALSNNHTFDYGIEGLRETMATLDAAGIPYTGVGENDTDSRKPYFIEQDGKRVAIINVCEHEYTYALPDRLGANPFDPFLTMRDIRAAKKDADYLIVLYHGGKEQCEYPSPRLRNLCQEMVHNGADVVLTQHSHCIGCYEEYEGGQILYGQGNFHFCKLASKMPSNWYTGLLVEVEITDRLSVKYIPFWSDDDSIMLAHGEKYDEIMNAFEERSAELHNGKWLDGWHEFCVAREEGYRKMAGAIGEATPETWEKQKQKFAHYLDCEAHTDVWRELYKTWNHTNK